MPQKSENKINSPRPAIKYIAFSSDKLSIAKIKRPIELNTNMIVAYVCQPLRSTYLTVCLFVLNSAFSDFMSFSGVPQKGHFSN